MMWLVIFTVFISALVAICYCWLKKCYRYWEVRNVPYIKVDSLVFGNMHDLMLGKISLGEAMKKFYDQLAPHRFGGIFSFQNPILILRDPNIIKAVLTRDYHYFHDRGLYLADKAEPLSCNLFNLQGEEWRIRRNKLSPIFSKSKVKATLPLVKECVDELITTIDRCIAEENSVDMKDLLARFSIDIVGSCFFGTQPSSLANPNSEFQRMGLKTFEMNFKMIIRQILFAFNPRFANSLGIKGISDEVNNFFMNLVKNTVTYRVKNNIIRNDFLNHLKNLLNQNKAVDDTHTYEITKEEVEFMAAECFLFFLAGYETTSNTASFTLFEIAKNSNVQDRLRKEIDDIWDKYDGNISYDFLNELTFMDQVIAEAMRMYPAIPMLMRTCTQNYSVPESDLVIEKGTVIYIPLYGLHHDPQYFPNPEIFDTDRFSAQNENPRPPFAYLPLGEGPKICIGMRFGLMQLKLALLHLLRSYTFSVSSKMKLPVMIKKRAVLVCCEGGIWLNCEKRK